MQVCNNTSDINKSNIKGELTLGIDFQSICSALNTQDWQNLHEVYWLKPGQYPVREKYN